MTRITCQFCLNYLTPELHRKYLLQSLRNFRMIPYFYVKEKMGGSVYCFVKSTVTLKSRQKSTNIILKYLCFFFLLIIEGFFLLPFVYSAIFHTLAWMAEVETETLRVYNLNYRMKRIVLFIWFIMKWVIQKSRATESE